MRQLSFGLRGKTDQLAQRLDHIVGQEVQSLRFSRESWEELVIGLRYDPCPLLFRRLLDGVSTVRPVQLLTDSTISGKLILLTPERLRVGFELGGHRLLCVSIGFDRDHMVLIGEIKKNLKDRRIDCLDGLEATKSVVTR